MYSSQSPPKFFLYARKSSESEDQQVASIDSQIKELEAIAQRGGLEVVDVLHEAQSAKAPGRPVFNEMLNRVSLGEAAGILCWKLDRLARNPVDGGNISWMLQQGIIQSIRTHERSYCPTDNVLMMSVEFGMANQYIRDLSHNVRRGLKIKVEDGWYPGVAKPGYINTLDQPKGKRTTPIDPMRFPLLKNALKLVLSGLHTPPQVLHKLNHEWGYRTPKRRKLGGVPLSRSRFYSILTDTFYYGRFEYPRGTDNWYQGKHQPMITEKEFWRIQELLGKDGRPRPKKYTFAYTGLIQCGECNGAITAEIKEHVVCSTCRRKFSSRHRAACPQCKTAIADMHQAIRRRYVYYHCTRRKKTPCFQEAVEVKHLEAQINEFLTKITISESIKDWCIRKIEREAQREVDDHIPIHTALEEARADGQKRLNNLLKLKISPQNSTGDLLSDEEFAQQKSDIQREIRLLEQQQADTEIAASQWPDTAKRAFTFACYAQPHFKKGSVETKRTILSSLGSNLTLQDKKLRISLHKHLLLIQRIKAELPARDGRFEPQILSSDNTQSALFEGGSCTWLRGWDDVRNLFHKLASDNIDIPNLPVL